MAILNLFWLFVQFIFWMTLPVYILEFGLPKISHWLRWISDSKYRERSPPHGSFFLPQRHKDTENNDRNNSAP